jgi:TatD DNase family protein
MTRPGDWPEPPEPLPVAVADNHTHIDIPAGDEPRSTERLIADAASVGVDRILHIGCDLDSARWTVEAIDRHPALLGGVALHPNDAARHAAGTHASGVGYDEAFAEMAALATNPRIRVIGETGLDRFRTGPDGREAQERSFREHIALAKELGKVLQIHDRDAHAEVIEVLERDGAPERTVMHCFSGDAAMARLCVEHGWYLSFAGNVTFRNADPLREALSATPLSRVLVETDAPYLTPHPHRGKPNASYLIPLTMREISRVLEVPIEEACAVVSTTTDDLYGPW